MRSTLLVFVAVFSSAFGLVGSLSAAAPNRPNVIYIMSDELGYFEPGFMGGQNIQTPNLDRMAAEGMRFNHLFAGSSVCAPTRCCFMTGKHSGHTSVRSNGGGTPMRADEATIASLLKPLGYATGGFGKWGCGGRDSTGVPEKHGFDLFLGYYDQVHAHSYYPPYLIRNGEEYALEGNKGGSTGATYSHYVIHQAAVDFIREHANQPFFAYLPYTPPHGLFDIPDDDPAWALYKDKPWPEPARRYAAMVTMVDRQVGEILSLLKQLGIDDNTLVFFSGDNGGMDYFASDEYPRGVHSANKHPVTGLEYRGRKGNLYEGGLRVPFLARWPGKIAPGTVSNHLGYFPDILPTIAEVAGANVPDDIDGISMVPELVGEQAAGRPQPKHDYLYWEIEGWTAIRQGDWRAVKPRRATAWELYNLQDDPGETKDLADVHAEVLTKLVVLAKSAHEPVREGTFSRTDRHERDRRAKFGKHDEVPADPPKPNVLFIPIDDLNHWVGHLQRHPQTQTPHIDRLSQQGVSFTRAYCAAPACNPSRIALMSGFRPSTTGCYDNSQDWRPTISEDTLLNKTLLDAGYNCYGTGKILHGSYGHSSQWTEYHRTRSPNLKRHPSAVNAGVGGIKFFPLAGDDVDMPDYDAVSYGIDVLNRKHDKPFFLAVGLVKPHMPFSVPKKWFDRFPLESIELPPHRENDLSDIPAAGVRMAKPDGDHAAMLASGRWKEAVQAYLATIAFCDAQVGRLLDALETSPYRDNTIVCLWSDHGWSLGEKSHWRKFALWEEPTRTVFIWKVPGMTPAGIQSPRPVDYMSIYPTICSLVGIDTPAHVEGLNIAPLLRNPMSEWSAPALTTFRQNNHAARNERWRYIRYADGSEELYDHDQDPYEWSNVATNPEFAPIKAALAAHFPEVNADELPHAAGGARAGQARRQRVAP